MEDLTFDPASEFEIIEELDFAEEVAKPESLRFFTLDEQLVDYFDKVLPKKKVITKFEYAKIAAEVDRLRDIYEKIITVTDTDYVVDLSRKVIDVPWVKPIYTSLELNSYVYGEKFAPLFLPPLRSAPNFYTRMLVALPKPYSTSGEGVSLNGRATLVDEEGKNEIVALGTYERTKGITHEDGSFTVVPVPVANTSDDIKTIGYFIEPRSQKIPNPLAEHPFLASNTRSKFITNEPLLDVFPSIEAIMTHGVPRTSFPYTEGLEYLKVYDVKLKDIPWDLWKTNFKPVEVIDKTPSILSVEFPPPKEEKNGPSKKLQEHYNIPWEEAMAPRFWLSHQEDGGTFLARMLLSEAGDHGLVPPAVLNEAPVRQLTSSTPEECLIETDFESFMSSGVFRAPKWSDIDKAVDKNKPRPTGHCIPTAFITQEKVDDIVAGKYPWKETTHDDIIKEHLRLLKIHQEVVTKKKAVVYEKFAGHPQSDLRRMILALMKDEERLPIDKAVDIEKLLRDIHAVEDVYYFADGSFLICAHTLAVMKGDLENDEKKFIERWTTIDEGFRACKSCGERVSANVFANVDEFDENGAPILSHGKLEEEGGFHGDEFAKSLRELKSVFNLESASESIFYLLLSLFQIVPEDTQLLPILQYLRGVKGSLDKSKAAKEVKDRTEGIFGINAMMTILLTHSPFLNPRRFFGKKVLKLAGYPRDTDDVEDSPVLDILISVLKSTFESIPPGTFKGPITAVLNKIIAKPKEVKKDAIGFIKGKGGFLEKFKGQFEDAKKRYVEPEKAEIVSGISFPVLRLDKPSFTPSERIGTETQSLCDVEYPSAYLTGRVPPNITQDPVILSKTNVSEHSSPLEKPDVLNRSIKISDAEIKRRVALKFPKIAKLEKIGVFLSSDTDGTGILSLVNRILDFMSFEKKTFKEVSQFRAEANFMITNVNPSLLRDTARGLAYEIFNSIKNEKLIIDKIKEALQRDLVMNMILITKEEATAQDSGLRTKEREIFKQRMRQMDDSQREVTKMMLDIGIAPYIITNEDRELFAREYKYTDPEAEYDRMMADADLDRPEEGFYNVDNTEDGLPMDDNVPVDNGDYGTREEVYNRGDYGSGNYDESEGFGV